MLEGRGDEQTEERLQQKQEIKACMDVDHPDSKNYYKFALPNTNVRQCTGN